MGDRGKDLIPIRLAELAVRLDGALQADGEALATGWALDNRAVAAGDVFMAIEGAKVDGHDYVSSAIASGAVAALVTKPVAEPHVLVANLPEALASYARSYRSRFDGPVVGITGSAGKTTTKEMITLAISSLGDILASSGNQNTEFTSPLIWSRLEPAHEAVVVEMAMRGREQIRHLAKMHRSTIGVITNIGHSHLSELGSREGIARAKGELFEELPEEGIAIAWDEDDFLPLHREISPAPVRTFGFSPAANCRILSYQPDGLEGSLMIGTCNGKEWCAKLPVVGKHLALDAAAAVLVAVSLGVDAAEAANQLEHLKLPGMRMEVREYHGGRIIVDTYNASPTSMAGALETMALTKVDGKRIALIGEMRELGDFTETAHRELAAHLVAANLDEIRLVGPPTQWTLEELLASGFPSAKVDLLDKAEDAQGWLSSITEGDLALVKGSRSLELERALPF